MKKYKPTIKTSWLDRAIDTAKLHSNLCNARSNHTIEDTAEMLNRSFGSVAEDLKIVSWLKTHDEIRKFKYAKEALEFIRVKSKSMRNDISHLD